MLVGCQAELWHYQAKHWQDWVSKESFTLSSKRFTVSKMSSWFWTEIWSPPKFKNYKIKGVQILLKLSSNLYFKNSKFWYMKVFWLYIIFWKCQMFLYLKKSKIFAYKGNTPCFSIHIFFDFHTISVLHFNIKYIIYSLLWYNNRNNVGLYYNIFILYIYCRWQQQQRTMQVQKMQQLTRG